MDRVSKEVRSKNMAAVRSKGNRSTELALGGILWAAGFRGYRKHWPVCGRPDFAWPSRKVAIFVDGCFWHGCTRCRSMPATNTAFWREKIDGNRCRDRRVSAKLRTEGWVVVRIKECKLFWPSTLGRIALALANRNRKFTNCAARDSAH